MRTMWVGAVVLALIGGHAVAASPAYRLADTRATSETAPQKLHKIVVIGISDDPEIRDHFEDKFVAHLRARSIAAVASHPVVPRLTAMGDRERILEFVVKEGVDGVLTIRAVPVEDDGKQAWAASWSAWSEKESSVRQLIEQTVPVAATSAKRYGIEFTLWTGPARKVWTARTDTYTRKELGSGVSDLLLVVIGALKDAGRL